MRSGRSLLTAPSDWLRLVAAALVIGFLAIPIHELGHILAYRLLGVHAWMSYARDNLPTGEHARSLGVAGGPLLTLLLCYAGIALIYRGRLLLLAYPLAVIMSLDRVLIYLGLWRPLLVLHRPPPGMDETRMAVLGGFSPYLPYLVITVLTLVAWLLIVRSLRFGALRNVLLALIPVAAFVGGAAFGVLVVERYLFPTQYQTQFGHGPRPTAPGASGRVRQRAR